VRGFNSSNLANYQVQKYSRCTLLKSEVTQSTGSKLCGYNVNGIDVNRRYI